MPEKTMGFEYDAGKKKKKKGVVVHPYLLNSKVSDRKMLCLNVWIEDTGTSTL